MRLATVVLVSLIGSSLILGGFGHNAAIAARHLQCPAASGRLPAEFALRAPLAPPSIGGHRAVMVARRAGAVIRKPYSARYGLWIAPDRESHVTTYDPGGPNARSCAAHRVYHHFLIIVGDKGSTFIEAAPY